MSDAFFRVALSPIASKGAKKKKKKKKKNTKKVGEEKRRKRNYNTCEFYLYEHHSIMSTIAEVRIAFHVFIIHDGRDA